MQNKSSLIPLVQQLDRIHDITDLNFIVEKCYVVDIMRKYVGIVPINAWALKTAQHNMWYVV